MLSDWLIFWVSFGQPILGAGLLFELIRIRKNLERRDGENERVD
jgi:hypothetical protein